MKEKKTVRTGIVGSGFSATFLLPNGINTVRTTILALCRLSRDRALRPFRRARGAHISHAFPWPWCLRSAGEGGTGERGGKTKERENLPP